MSNFVKSTRIDALKKTRNDLVEQRRRINGQIKMVDLELDRLQRKQQVCEICGGKVENTDFARAVHLRDVHGFTIAMRRAYRVEGKGFKWVEIA